MLCKNDGVNRKSIFFFVKWIEIFRRDNVNYSKVDSNTTVIDELSEQPIGVYKELQYTVNGRTQTHTLNVGLSPLHWANQHVDVPVIKTQVNGYMNCLTKFCDMPPVN